MLSTIGRRKMNDAALRGDDLGTLTLKLFKNNYTPVAAMVAGDFTEATFAGYTDQDIEPTDWAAAVADGTDAVSVGPELTWDPGGSETIYGWYAVDGDGDVIMAKKSTTAKSSAVGLTVTPEFTHSPPA